MDGPHSNGRSPPPVDKKRRKEELARSLIQQWDVAVRHCERPSQTPLPLPTISEHRYRQLKTELGAIQHDVDETLDGQINFVTSSKRQVMNRLARTMANTLAEIALEIPDDIFAGEAHRIRAVWAYFEALAEPEDPVVEDDLRSATRQLEMILDVASGPVKFGASRPSRRSAIQVSICGHEFANGDESQARDFKKIGTSWACPWCEMHQLLRVDFPAWDIYLLSKGKLDPNYDPGHGPEDTRDVSDLWYARFENRLALCIDRQAEMLERYAAHSLDPESQRAACAIRETLERVGHVRGDPHPRDKRRPHGPHHLCSLTIETTSPPQWPSHCTRNRYRKTISEGTTSSVIHADIRRFRRTERDNTERRQIVSAATHMGIFREAQLATHPPSLIAETLPQLVGIGADLDSHVAEVREMDDETREALRFAIVLSLETHRQMTVLAPHKLRGWQVTEPMEDVVSEGMSTASPPPPPQRQDDHEDVNLRQAMAMSLDYGQAGEEAELKQAMAMSLEQAGEDDDLRQAIAMSLEHEHEHEQGGEQRAGTDGYVPQNSCTPS